MAVIFWSNIRRLHKAMEISAAKQVQDITLFFCISYVKLLLTSLSEDITTTTNNKTFVEHHSAVVSEALAEQVSCLNAILNK